MIKYNKDRTRTNGTPNFICTKCGKQFQKKYIAMNHDCEFKNEKEK